MPMYYLQLVLVCLLYSIFYCLEAEYIEANIMQRTLVVVGVVG